MTAPDTRPPADDRGPSEAIWEPYQFKLGDRVICKPSPECRVAWLSLDGVIGHPPEETDVWGTVEQMPAEYRHEPWNRSHPYAVRFDCPGIEVDGVIWWGGMFASIELEPLVAAQAPDAEGEAQS